MPFPYLKAYRWPKGLNFVGKCKLAMKEQPLILTVGIIFVIGLAYHQKKIQDYKNLGTDIKRYKMLYTVYRPDDPRVKSIKQ